MGTKFKQKNCFGISSAPVLRSKLFIFPVTSYRRTFHILKLEITLNLHSRVYIMDTVEMLARNIKILLLFITHIKISPITIIFYHIFSPTHHNIACRILFKTDGVFFIYFKWWLKTQKSKIRWIDLLFIYFIHCQIQNVTYKMNNIIINVNVDLGHQFDWTLKKTEAS